MSEQNKKNNNSKRGGKHGTDTKPVPSDDLRRGARVRNGKNSCFRDSLKSRNDPQWYVYDAHVGESSGNLFYSNPLGQNIIPEGMVESSLPYTRVPGLMVLSYVPVPGYSTGDPDAPVNVAAQSIYSFVRSKNSGSKNYEKSDLMMYLLALDSLYAMYADGMRAYGLANAYSLTNKFYPRVILENLGWDYTALSSNLAKMNTNLGIVAHALGSLAAPAGMSFYTRHLWMSSHIWVDTASKKAQSYAFNMRNYWQWNGRTSETGTQLIPKLYHQGAVNKYTPDTWMDLMLSEIQRLLADEDVGIISGDIIKAFGDTLMKVGTVPLDYVVYPEYEESVIMQIQNAVIIGTMNLNSSTISQENNLIKTDLEIRNSNQGYGARGGFINLRKEVPTWQDNYEATRLTNILRFTGTPDLTPLSKPETLGSEFITGISVIGSGQHGINSVYTVNQSVVVDDETTVGQASQFLINAALLEKFDWHPYVYVTRAGVAGADNNALECFSGDTDNYTIISLDTLKQMNRVALTTQFICDGLGTFNPAVLRF